jgi:hypothetical protein
MIILTYWEDPPNKNDKDDYDGIKVIRLKSIKQIPELLKNKPNNCTMISTEHSAERTLKNGRKTNFFKVIWEGKRGSRILCPHCKGTGKI